MSDYILGEIRIFAGNYVPNYWARCNGDIILINDNMSLYSLISDLYGGDGRNTFALPDMRGRIPIHMGKGPDLTDRTIAARFGTDMVTLEQDEIPEHSHALQVQNISAITNDPTSVMFAIPDEPLYDDLNVGATPPALNSNSIDRSGGNYPHENIMPSLALTYMICVQNGVYPERKK